MLKVYHTLWPRLELKNSLSHLTDPSPKLYRGSKVHNFSTSSHLCYANVPAHWAAHPKGISHAGSLLKLKNSLRYLTAMPLILQRTKSPKLLTGFSIPSHLYRRHLNCSIIIIIIVFIKWLTERNHNNSCHAGQNTGTQARTTRPSMGKCCHKRRKAVTSTAPGREVFYLKSKINFHVPMIVLSFPNLLQLWERGGRSLQFSYRAFRKPRPLSNET